VTDLREVAHRALWYRAQGRKLYQNRLSDFEKVLADQERPDCLNFGASRKSTLITAILLAVLNLMILTKHVLPAYWLAR
jgi:hypothetical protein